MDLLNILPVAKLLTLPVYHFQAEVENAIDKNELDTPENRQAFVRECVAYFEGILPRPSTVEYSAISRKICDKYPCLKDRRASKY